MKMLQSDDLKYDLLNYLELLLAKQSNEPNKRVPIFGSAKGIFQMSDDFDEPLVDFESYMSK